MTALQHLRVRGYRRLLDVDLAMKPFSVLIGTNGAGKTSFLEVLSLLAASGNAQMSARISDLGGIGDIVTRDKSTAIELDLSSPVEGHEPLDYNLRIEPRGQGYWIQRETLTQHRGVPAPFKHIDADNGQVRYFDMRASGLVQPDWALNPLETALSQVPKMFREPEALRQTLAGTTFYASLNVTPKSPVRLPQQMRPATLPGSQGEDLVPCLYSLRENDPDRFEVLEDTLSSAFPDFERLAFPAAAGMLAMTWKDKNYSRPMYMHQLSEGTLRFLWLATLLGSRDLPPITLLDEPEVSLHPELQSLLVKLMREASARSQIVVATHSDRLVRFLQPEELLVVETVDGSAKLTWADTMEIEDWLADYSLDELLAYASPEGDAVKITILVEGDTERVFMPPLRAFLSRHLSGNMPNLTVRPYDGRIPKEDRLRRIVEDLLTKRPTPADAVIALTDVYTGSSDFTNAADAKAKMNGWVKNNERFYPHVAQHDFEAWLLPYWATIQKLAKHNMAAPSGPPEQVNHDRPPAARIKEIFERGKCRDSYVKPRDALRILKNNDLSVAVGVCPELKALLNTIIRLSGGATLP